MARQSLFDDSGYRGFDECANYESCTDSIIAELLEPYDVESIEELVTNAYNKGRKDAIDELLDLIESDTSFDSYYMENIYDAARQTEMSGEPTHCKYDGDCAIHKNEALKNLIKEHDKNIR